MGLPETFTERFNRLTAPLKDTEVAMLLDISSSALRKIKEGETQSLKLDGALRLCKRLRVSPWELAGESEPLPMTIVSAGTGTGKTSVFALLHMLAQREGISLLVDPADAPRVEWQVHLESLVDDLARKVAETNEEFAKLGEPAKTRESPQPASVPARTKARRR